MDGTIAPVFMIAPPTYAEETACKVGLSSPDARKKIVGFCEVCFGQLEH